MDSGLPSGNTKNNDKSIIISPQSPSCAKPQVGGARQLSKADQELLDWQLSHIKNPNGGFSMAKFREFSGGSQELPISDRDRREDENESSAGAPGRIHTSAAPRNRKPASLKRKRADRIVLKANVVSSKKASGAPLKTAAAATVDTRRRSKRLSDSVAPSAQPLLPSLPSTTTNFGVSSEGGLGNDESDSANKKCKTRHGNNGNPEEALLPPSIRDEGGEGTEAAAARYGIATLGNANNFDPELIDFRKLGSKLCADMDSMLQSLRECYDSL